ncbi:hypothetical protein BJ944DRAFT_237220 [Cunninghamella echinulata]|nr:hypothetical protein BJ944DRAFT_237220 [Cunninghamella echinulata]
MNTLNSYSVQIFDTISQLQKQFDDINLKHEELSQKINNTRDNGITEDELANVKIMMNKTSEYNAKLLSLRTTMVNMSIKSKQLIQRADKLKATKIEYLSKVDTIRKLEQERDKSIAAQIVDNNNNNGHINKPLSLSPSSSSLSLNTQEIEKNRVSSSSPLLSASPVQQTNITTSTSTTLENKLSPSYSSSSIIIPSNSNNNISRSSSSSPILTPLSSPPPTSATPILHEPSHSSSTTTVMAMAKKKKKKKPKVREVVIGSDDDEPAWVPKKSLSNQINNP